MRTVALISFSLILSVSKSHSQLGPLDVPIIYSATLWGFADVLTQHNDNARTGANLRETQLNTTNVNAGQFGLLFTLPVDGQIHSQPLYVSNLAFPDGKRHNVVYVTTAHN